MMITKILVNYSPFHIFNRFVAEFVYTCLINAPLTQGSFVMNQQPRRKLDNHRVTIFDTQTKKGEVSGGGNS